MRHMETFADAPWHTAILADERSTASRAVRIQFVEQSLGIDEIWSCPGYVPVSQLIYAAFRSKAKGLLPPSDEWRRRGL